jgi:hypothetical protein
MNFANNLLAAAAVYDGRKGFPREPQQLYLDLPQIKREQVKAGTAAALVFNVKQANTGNITFYLKAVAVLADPGINKGTKMYTIPAELNNVDETKVEVRPSRAQISTIPVIRADMF